MNENLNLVEILKKVPTGTKLYSPLFGTVKLKRIDLSDDETYPVGVVDSADDYRSFTGNGKYYAYRDGECLLFPSKEYRDWSTFLLPKPGDFVYRKLKSGNEWISVHKKEEDDKVVSFVDCSKDAVDMYMCNCLCNLDDIIQQRKATQEEKQMVIQKMLSEKGILYHEKENRLIQLQPGTFFKVHTVGDREYCSIFKEIRDSKLFTFANFRVNPASGNIDFPPTCFCTAVCKISDVADICLATPDEVDLCEKCLEELKLSWNKDLLSLTKVYEDKEEFKPFQQVLVRDRKSEPWQIEFFSHMNLQSDYPYDCLRSPYKYCIPFEGNNDKLGKV